MAEADLGSVESMSVDVENLYREESITDLQAATIRQLIPVKIDGSEDPSRSRRFIGDTTLMTQMGPIPVQFPLDAETLEGACELFPEGIKGAIEKLNERAREMAREEASRIVVPGQGQGPAPGGAGLLGGKF
jgi:hypothetical protein